jgi:hypothetical protein
LDLVTEAFPIIVFAKQLENKERKLMEIMECEALPTAPAATTPSTAIPSQKPHGK